MTRDEFKKKLATGVGRTELGIELTADDAAGVLADDEVLDRLYAALQHAAPQSHEINATATISSNNRGFMKRRPWIFALCIAGLLAVVGVSVAVIGQLNSTTAPDAAAANVPTQKETFTAVGTLAIHSAANNPCFYTEGLADVQEGAPVIVTGAAGKTLAIGALSNPVHSSWGSCTLEWSVPGVPAGEKFYGVEVSHRGVVKLSESDLRDKSNALRVG